MDLIPEHPKSKQHSPRSAPRVLIIFFSFSGQTVGLLNQLAAGLSEQRVKVTMEKLQPVKALRFPVGSVPSTLMMMLTTFLRFPVAINKPSANCRRGYDLVVLAGPTWSYNPSGPVLSLLARYGKEFFAGQSVLPLISCRGYWRLHWYGLRHLLQKCGAIVVNRMVFSHPVREPWSTIGVFLKIAGKNPERMRLIGRFYQRYGHSKEQRDEAWRFGLIIGEALQRKTSLAEINFHTRVALP